MLNAAFQILNLKKVVRTVLSAMPWYFIHPNMKPLVLKFRG
jgi:hypothetical protein